MHCHVIVAPLLVLLWMAKCVINGASHSHRYIEELTNNIKMKVSIYIYITNKSKHKITHTHTKKKKIKTHTKYKETFSWESLGWLIENDP